MTDLQALNDQYAIHGYLNFVAGPAGLPMAEIHTRHADALVAVQGGHIARFQPQGAAPLLWVSRISSYAAGKAIRGGIPVCWPWFAQHPSDPTLPFHGFVRARMWHVRGAAVLPDELVQLRLGLNDNEDTRAIWPHAFDLELVATVGPTLQVELISRNTDNTPYSVGGALHTYFQVGDSSRVAIRGLEGTEYIDKVDGGARKRQDGPVTFAGEVDRIYLDTAADCLIDDPALGRTVRVGKANSRTTVVWNPWIEKARAMPDAEDDDYRDFVCVETVNAQDDVFDLQPGDTHTLSLTIGLQ
jgi:D-hexose-6-phosphate mutarotase